MRVAVAHEWLTNWAGSERVARELVTVGQAEQLVASVVDRSFTAEYFPDVDVRALWTSRLPNATTHWSRLALPMLAAWASTKVEADLLLVSSHFAAHGATVRFDGPSIVYYHTPARMLWRPDIELARLPERTRTAVEKGVLPALRAWDRRVAQHPTVLLGNSTAVVERIARRLRAEGGGPASAGRGRPMVDGAPARARALPVDGPAGGLQASGHRRRGRAALGGGAGDRRLRARAGPAGADGASERPVRRARHRERAARPHGRRARAGLPGGGGLRDRPGGGARRRHPGGRLRGGRRARLHRARRQRRAVPGAGRRCRSPRR